MNNEQPRKPIQDIVVPHHELLRREGATLRYAEAVPPKEVKEPTSRRIEDNPFFAKNTESHKTTQRTKSVWLLGVLGSLVFVFLGFSLFLAYFASTEIEITPLKKNVTLEHEFIATVNPTTDELGFKFMSFTEEKTKEIPATVEKKIQKKSSGTVLIYNSYSVESQRLIKNTRLESPDRKIFRIDESVVVPGAKISTKQGDRGKILLPGVVEVSVYADVPGKEYDIGLSDFTIPGFKGDPRYTKFTARSKPGSPLSGGFSGTIKIPTEVAIMEAHSELKEELKKEVAEKAQVQVPEGSSFFPGSVVIKFEEIPQVFSTESSFKISLRAVTSVFFFDTQSLSKEIIKKILPGDRAETFFLANMPSISFAFVDKVEGLVLSDVTRIRFNLKGNASFLGQIHTSDLPKELAGKTGEDAATFIKTQYNVEKINVTNHPFWKKTLSDKSERIFIKVLTPSGFK